jgi:hypothetical protein
MMNAIAGWFTQVFTSSLFLLLAVPLLVALMAVVLKSAARPGKTFPVTREDFLIGFDLGVMAIVTMLAVAAKAAKDLQSLHAKLSNMNGGLNQTMVTDLTNGIQISATYVVSAFIFVILFSLCLFAISRIVARKGWKGSPLALTVPWILGVDLVGFVLLGATLLMTGEVK